MKWNPGFFGGVNPGPHQYASDVGWAYKQVNRISSIFNLLDSYSMILDIPKYR